MGGGGGKSLFVVYPLIGDGRGGDGDIIIVNRGA